MSRAAEADGNTGRQRAAFEDESVQGAADRFIAWTVVLGESDQGQGEAGSLVGIQKPRNCSETGQQRVVLDRSSFVEGTEREREVKHWASCVAIPSYQWCSQARNESGAVAARRQEYRKVNAEIGFSHFFFLV